jgi:cysteine-rich repeat protein
MPGEIYDNINSLSTSNKNRNKVSIIDIRTLDEVMRWPLHDCGDGVYNTTAFEQCDYASPGYNQNPQNTAYVYAASKTSVVTNGVTAAPYNYNIFFDTTLNGYYTCDTNCQRLPISLCGDGIESNGPNRDKGFEECDDGNNISGDGCSSTCKIEYGYSCPASGT